MCCHIEEKLCFETNSEKCSPPQDYGMTFCEAQEKQDIEKE